MLVRFEPKVFMQNDGFFVDVILLLIMKGRVTAVREKKIQKPQNLNSKISKNIVFHFCLPVCYPKM